MTKKKATKKTALKQPPFRAGTNPRKRVQAKCRGPRMTKQSHAAELDVNRMLQRFTRTGELPNLSKAVYGDDSGVDFIDAQFALARAKSEFELLPDEVRARYGSVDGVIDALNDPDSHQQLFDDQIIDAGLLNALGGSEEPKTEEIQSGETSDSGTESRSEPETGSTENA